MNPLSINPLHMLGGAVLAMIIGFGAGWTTNGWRLGTEIADMKRVDAEAISTASQAALLDYAAGAKKIKDAAVGAQVDVSSMHSVLADIQRRMKNAPPPPLPPDCRPGPLRLQYLTEAAATTDKAAARPEPSR